MNTLVGSKYRVVGWLPCNEHLLHEHTLIISYDDHGVVHFTDGEKATLPYAEAMTLMQALRDPMVTNLTQCDHCNWRGADAVEAKEPLNLCKACMALFLRGEALVIYPRDLTFTLDLGTGEVKVEKYIAPEYDDSEDEETCCPACGREYE